MACYVGGDDGSGGTATANGVASHLGDCRDSLVIPTACASALDRVGAMEDPFCRLKRSGEGSGSGVRRVTRVESRA